jgi:hypothetical protein
MQPIGGTVGIGSVQFYSCSTVLAVLKALGHWCCTVLQAVCVAHGTLMGFMVLQCHAVYFVVTVTLGC